MRERPIRQRGGHGEEAAALYCAVDRIVKIVIIVTAVIVRVLSLRLSKELSKGYIAGVAALDALVPAPPGVVFILFSLAVLGRKMTLLAADPTALGAARIAARVSVVTATSLPVVVVYAVCEVGVAGRRDPELRLRWICIESPALAHLVMRQ